MERPQHEPTPLWLIEAPVSTYQTGYGVAYRRHRLCFEKRPRPYLFLAAFKCFRHPFFLLLTPNSSLCPHGSGCLLLPLLEGQDGLRGVEGPMERCRGS